MATNQADVVIPDEASTAVLPNAGHRPSLDGEEIEVGDYVRCVYGSGYVEEMYPDNHISVFVGDEHGTVLVIISQCTMVAKQFRLPV